MCVVGSNGSAVKGLQVSLISSHTEPKFLDSVNAQMKIRAIERKAKLFFDSLPVAVGVSTVYR